MEVPLVLNVGVVGREHQFAGVAIEPVESFLEHTDAMVAGDVIREIKRSGGRRTGGEEEALEDCIGFAKDGVRGQVTGEILVALEPLLRIESGVVYAFGAETLRLHPESIPPSPRIGRLT